MRVIYRFAPALLICTAPAFASVTANSPVNGSTVPSPFTLTATASPCSSQPISAMGYSLDGSTSTITVSGASISAQVAAATGSHVVHVKSWGNQGASCVADVSINIVTSTSTPVTNVIVGSPLYGASVTSPFSLNASGSLCSSQPISAMGYSLDSGSTSIVNATSINATVASTAGSHTLHVKSWGNQGASCVADVAVTVTVLATNTLSAPSIPSNAIAVNAIQKLNTWQASFDSGTGGTAYSSGTMSLVNSPSLSSAARQFVTTYSNYGGERYYTAFGTDSLATNFVFDASLYIASPSNDIANIEMDLNQVMGNGQTVIFGFQCDGWSKTWDYTTNTGTPQSPNDQWLHSNQTCNPQAWATNTWHHVQVSFSRDSSGNVNYKSVWLDGVQQDLNITAPSAFALGWAPTLLTNFQVDGMTSTQGTSTIYIDNLIIYRW